MLKRPRTVEDKHLIDGHITQASAPRALALGKGLASSVGGNKRARRLVDGTGGLIAAGQYHYEATQRKPPDQKGGFDYAQTPVQIRNRLQVRFADGRLGTVRTLDGVERKWRLINLGNKFCRDGRGHYTERSRHSIV